MKSLWNYNNKRADYSGNSVIPTITSKFSERKINNFKLPIKGIS